MWTILFWLVTAVYAIPRIVHLSPEVVAKRDAALLAIEALDAAGKHVPPEVRQLLGGGDDYAPYKVDCPTGWTWVRPASSLSTGEQNYLNQRKPYLPPAINQMMTNAGLPAPPRAPVIGLALSGGGYRAMQSGLGGVMAMMNASSEAAASGIGGWFDGVTYMAGLSGGSWATGTFMVNGGRLPTDLVNNVWNLQSNLIFPSDNKASFYYDLVSEVRAKSAQGWPTQITDYWALALGEHLLPSQYHLSNSPNFTLAQLPTVPALANGSLPMPIIIAAEREPDEIVIAENATVWEFTPFEFGSWAFGSQRKVRGAFTNMEYLGSELNNGTPNGTCWKGFDQLSFVLGTSSTLFNSAFLQINGTNSDSLIVSAIEAILGAVGSEGNDVALYPNSFANWNAQENPISNLSRITLVDAGETNQNVPLEPLLTPYRNVDAIIAFDSSADTTYSWPNGTALRTTYERARILAENQDVKIRMPEIPSANGFINGGLNTRPTFFGCEANGTTPIIVYVPSYPWSTAANFSTFKLAYNQTESLNLINNGMRSFTLNGSVPSWPQCLACALSDRSFGYTSANRTGPCQACFDTWCWNGQDNTTEPAGYEPNIGSTPAWLSQNNLVTARAQAGSVTTSSAALAATSASAASTSVGLRGVGSLCGATIGVVLGVYSVW